MGPLTGGVRLFFEFVDLVFEAVDAGGQLAVPPPPLLQIRLQSRQVTGQSQTQPGKVKWRRAKRNGGRKSETEAGKVKRKQVKGKEGRQSESEAGKVKLRRAK